MGDPVAVLRGVCRRGESRARETRGDSAVPTSISKLLKFDPLHVRS